jgi:hypothetical protein
VVWCSGVGSRSGWAGASGDGGDGESGCWWWCGSASGGFGGLAAAAGRRGKRPAHTQQVHLANVECWVLRLVGRAELGHQASLVLRDAGGSDPEVWLAGGVRRRRCAGATTPAQTNTHNMPHTTLQHKTTTQSQT